MKVPSFSRKSINAGLQSLLPFRRNNSEMLVQLVALQHCSVQLLGRRMNNPSSVPPSSVNGLFPPPPPPLTFQISDFLWSQGEKYTLTPYPDGNNVKGDPPPDTQIPSPTIGSSFAILSIHGNIMLSLMFYH